MAKELTTNDLVNGFWAAKTRGSPWVHLSKIRAALGVSHKQLDNLVTDILIGKQSRQTDTYSAAFELSGDGRFKVYGKSVRHTTYQVYGVNMVSLIPKK